MVNHLTIIKVFLGFTTQWCFLGTSFEIGGLALRNMAPLWSKMNCSEDARCTTTRCTRCSCFTLNRCRNGSWVTKRTTRNLGDELCWWIFWLSQWVPFWFPFTRKGVFLDFFHFFWLFLKRNVQGKVRREVERPKATLRPRPSGWTTARSWTSMPLIRIRVSIQRCLRDGKIPGEPHGDFCFFHDDGKSSKKYGKRSKTWGTPNFETLPFFHHFYGSLP